MMAAMATQRDADARLETVRSLLAKAEATPFPEEAEAFNAKAAELMTRYAIEEAMLWATRPPQPSDVIEIRIEMPPPFIAQKSLLAAGVAEAHGCLSVRLDSGRQGAPALISIVGLATSVSSVEALITSLLVQLAVAMARADAVRATDIRTPSTASETAAWRRSFIAGFGSSIISRLREQQAAAAANGTSSNGADGVVGERGEVTADGPSTALVLAKRDAHVRSEFNKRFPYIRTSRVSMGSSAAGRSSGASAGARADLGGSRIGGRRSLPGSSTRR